MLCYLHWLSKRRMSLTGKFIQTLRVTYCSTQTSPLPKNVVVSLEKSEGEEQVIRKGDEMVRTKGFQFLLVPMFNNTDSYRKGTSQLYTLTIKKCGGCASLGCEKKVKLLLLKKTLHQKKEKTEEVTTSPSIPSSPKATVTLTITVITTITTTYTARERHSKTLTILYFRSHQSIFNRHSHSHQLYTQATPRVRNCIL